MGVHGEERPGSEEMNIDHDEGRQKIEKKWVMVSVAACLVLGGIAMVSAQEFPTRAIHMIVPLTHGSSL